MCFSVRFLNPVLTERWLSSYCCVFQSELSRLEQSMADSRKEREKVLADYRAKANEKKEFAEKVERRVS